MLLLAIIGYYVTGYLFLFLSLIIKAIQAYTGDRDC